MAHIVEFPPQVRGVPRFPRLFEWPFIELKWRLPRIQQNDFNAFIDEYLLFVDALAAIMAMATMPVMTILIIVSLLYGGEVGGYVFILIFATIIYAITSIGYRLASAIA